MAFMSVVMAGFVGCSEESGPAVKKKSVAAAGLCGGAVSADATKALQLISGSEKFEPTGKDSTTASAAQQVIGNLSPLSENPSMAPEDLCRIHPDEEPNHEEIRVQFHLLYGKSAEQPGGDPAGQVRARRRMVGGPGPGDGRTAPAVPQDLVEPCVVCGVVSARPPRG
ncbi:hypothetical protein ACFU8Q_10430 [Streptomyces sp. NPDC057543]|uniref:hypothetical protein n=1 Tax=Streptomyces sp. NPDC057543 TaxID=3346163 RepID=UPI0036ADF112